MRDHAARIAAAAALVVFGAAHWVRLEEPSMSLRSLLVLAVVAAAPALVAAAGHVRAAVATAIVAAVAGIGLTLRLWPWSAGAHAYPRAVLTAVEDGARNWFAAHTPFDPTRFPAVDREARLAFFALAAGLVWALVARRSALAAVGIGFVLFALPSTDVALGAGPARAAVFLALALAALGASDRRLGRGSLVPQTLVLGTAAVVAGLVVGSAPGVTKAAFLGWQRWNPLARPDPSVNVQYVWNETFSDLHWPHHRTVIMDVWSPQPLYWKAAVLTRFTDGRWRLPPESVPLANQTGGQVTIPPGDLPVNVTDSGTDILGVHVKVLGLADPHLVSAGQPVRWSLPAGIRSLVDTDGVVATTGDPRRGATYSASVYAPDPTPQNLATTGTAYPPDVVDGITVAQTAVPPFGSGGTVPPPLPPNYIAASDQVWAASNADRAHDPYTAAALVEHYLRSAPFRYDLTPHLRGPAPLVGFLTRTHAGYCQMFAGAMALVLRLHGIPARVAVGFTSGRPPQTEGGPYVVTDRNAHAWVEVYFPAYGWLPFDPTPTRHLPEAYSLSSVAFSKAFPGGGTTPRSTSYGTVAKFLGLKGTPGTKGLDPLFHGRGRGVAGGGGVFTGTFARPQSHHGRFVTWLAWAALAVVLGILAVKAAAVRWRYLRRGPRARAAAAYHDLATFVGDQGLRVGPDRTFEELAGEVQDAFGVPVSAFAHHASRARYAPPRSARAAEVEMRRELRGVKRALRSRLSARERATGALRLRTALAQGSRRE
jgi:protein-glutamine gamma-glutamyltransferase